MAWIVSEKQNPPCPPDRGKYVTHRICEAVSFIGVAQEFSDSLLVMGLTLYFL